MPPHNIRDDLGKATIAAGVRKKDLSRRSASGGPSHRRAAVPDFNAEAISRTVFATLLLARMNGCFWRIQGMLVVGRTKTAISLSLNRGEPSAYSTSCPTQSDFAESGEIKTTIASQARKPLSYLSPQSPPETTSEAGFQTSIPRSGRRRRNDSAHFSSDPE